MKSSRKWVQRRRNDLLLHRSDAEKTAYRILRSLGYEVVRQKPIYTGRRLYYADLYLPSLKAIVEIDGGYHGTREQTRLDRNRSAGLRRLGFHVLRLSNHDARSCEKVKRKLAILTKGKNST